jgi:hypothetical protein
VEIFRNGSRQHWHFVTDSDEDAAHARLKAYLYGAAPRAAPPPASVAPELSHDAIIVRYVRIHLARAGWQGDGFPLVCGDDATWTRERWDRAAAELAQSEAAWQHATTLHRFSDLMGVGDPLEPVRVSAAEEESME